MKNIKFITLLYSFTIFIGAFLMFLIQPLVGKIITPQYGGTSQVWCLCLLFFQLTLLAGYSLTYFLSKLSTKKQCLIYLLLLLSAAITAKVPLGQAWMPDLNINPVANLMFQFIRYLSIPIIILSTVSTIFQKWYNSITGENPYYLYGISNIGSLSALFLYPFIIEPNFSVKFSVNLWEIAYYVLFLVAFVSTLIMFINSKNTQNQINSEDNGNNNKIFLKDYSYWIFLSAFGTTLLISYTNHLTHDIAPVPLLWIIPLAIYLSTFIICFGRNKIYNRLFFIKSNFILFSISAISFSLLLNGKLNFIFIIFLNLLTLFSLCMTCHGEIYERKPHPSNLPLFYLSIAFGGALGGIFVNIIAPFIFKEYIEFFLILYIMAIFNGYLICKYHPGRFLNPKNIKAYIAVVLFISIFIFYNVFTPTDEYKVISKRNFYGTAKVVYSLDKRKLMLINGSTNHGSQLIDVKTNKLTNFATTYYGNDSAIGFAIRLLRQNKQTPLKVGVIGLGVGTIASYGEKGDDFTFYDIDPKVKAIAENYFTFLKQSKAKINIIIGDGRLSLQKIKPQNYDLLIIDAFSSDAIPVHLLTQESIRIYKNHVNNDGIIMFHTSNRYLKFNSVLGNIAGSEGLEGINLISVPTSKENYKTNYTLLYKNSLFYKLFKDMKPVDPNVNIKIEKIGSDKNTGIWTDNYSNLFSVINFSGS